MQIDESKYNIVKEMHQFGVIKYICKEKERRCEYCKELTDTSKIEILRYTDKTNYTRYKELCRWCHSQLKHLT